MIPYVYLRNGNWITSSSKVIINCCSIYRWQIMVNRMNRLMFLFVWCIYYVQRMKIFQTHTWYCKFRNLCMHLSGSGKSLLNRKKAKNIGWLYKESHALKQPESRVLSMTYFNEWDQWFSRIIYYHVYMVYNHYFIINPIGIFLEGVLRY